MSENISFGKKVFNLNTNNGIAKKDFDNKLNEHQQKLLNSVFGKKFDVNQDGILDAGELKLLEGELKNAASGGNANNLGKTEARNFMQNQLGLSGADLDVLSRDDLYEILDIIQQNSDSIESAKTSDGVTTVKYNSDVLTDDNGRKILSESYIMDGETPKPKSKDYLSRDGWTEHELYEDGYLSSYTRTKGAITETLDPSNNNRITQRFTNKGTITEIVKFVYDDETGTVTEQVFENGSDKPLKTVIKNSENKILSTTDFKYNGKTTTATVTNGNLITRTISEDGVIKEKVTVNSDGKPQPYNHKVDTTNPDEHWYNIVAQKYGLDPKSDYSDIMEIVHQLKDANGVKYNQKNMPETVKLLPSVSGASGKLYALSDIDPASDTPETEPTPVVNDEVEAEGGDDDGDTDGIKLEDGPVEKKPVTVTSVTDSEDVADESPRVEAVSVKPAAKASNSVDIKSNAKPNIKIDDLEKYFNADGSLKTEYSRGYNSSHAMIEGKVIITDANGKPVEMPLKINPATLAVMKHGATDRDALNKIIIKDLTDAVNGLPANLKSDLFNEVSELIIERYDGNSSTGSFNSTNNSLTLCRSYGGSFENVFLGSMYDGINSITIAHELGHAIDTLHGKQQTQTEFKNKFNEFKDYLVKKGIISRNYERGTDISKYFMVSEKEFLAEYTAYSNGIDEHSQYGNRYDLIRRFEKSDDPEIKRMFGGLTADCERFAANSRGQGIAERQGATSNVYESRLAELGTSLKTNNTRIDLGANYQDVKNILNEDDFYEIFDSNFGLMDKFYHYLQNDPNYAASNKVFAKYEQQQDNPEWTALKNGLYKMLNEHIGYKR